MNAGYTPEDLFAEGCDNATNWLTTNSTRRRPVSAAVNRAFCFTEMVNRYETEDNFDDLLPAWERGYDSTMGAAGTPIASTDRAHAPALLAELKHAHAIIKAMLNVMTLQQKAKVHEQLDRAGVSGEGMTRANERLAAIEAAEVGSATPNGASSQGQSQQLLDIEAQAVEVILEADRADILLEEVFEKLEGLGTSPAVLAIECFTTCAARAVSLMHEAADNIVSLVAEGVAA